MPFIQRNVYIRINRALCKCGLAIQSIKITVFTRRKPGLFCGERESSELNADSWFFCNLFRAVETLFETKALPARVFSLVLFVPAVLLLVDIREHNNAL